MFTAFSTALSGLNAMTTAIDVVGNNLANLNTTGYKDQTVSFEDLVADSLSGNQATQLGLGTAQPTTSANFIQGAVQDTSGSYDGAINGAGFFVVKNTNGQQLYTRAGDFALNQNGFLTTQTGEFVQGWSATNGPVNPSGALSDIQVPVGEAIPAKESTEFGATINLDSSTAAGGTWSTGAINVVDSLGNSVPLSVTFTKDPGTPAVPPVLASPGPPPVLAVPGVPAVPPVPGKWTYAVTGTGVTVGSPVTVANPLGLATGTVQFDSSGNLVTPSAGNGSIPLTLNGFTDGAAGTTVNWNIYSPVGSATGVSSLTQYSEASNLSANSGDGQPAAVLTGVSLQNGGQIVATYSNGAAQQVVAQLALASVRNPQSLEDVGNNNFSVGTDSATPTIGASGVGGLGTIDGGSLEGSTVDIATEFANLLTYERSYQANSRVVTVSDELAQDAVNLVK
jgi:flagellar hook protein FlgE